MVAGLTDRAVKAATPGEKTRRLPDGFGLYLQIEPTGGKLWRYRYRFGGREKMISLGKYPQVSLAEARRARDGARSILDQGKDPSVEKALVRAASLAEAGDTFEVVARDWFERRSPSWVPRHASICLRSLEGDVFPSLGRLPIRAITAPIVLKLIREIEGRGALDVAKRVRQRISAVFVHGIATGRCEADPAAIITSALAAPQKKKRAAVTTIEDAREVLAAVERVPAQAISLLAHRLLALTAARPGEVLGARWAEFEGLDGPEPVWRIPAGRMKMRAEHIIPLPPQAIEVLRVLHPLSGRTDFLFPNARRVTAPANITLLAAILLRAECRGRHMPHGWRAAFSTIMNEHFPEDRAVIDLMLAHAPRNQVEAAYNRAAHRARRRELARIWADLLLQGARPAQEVVSEAHR